MAQVLGQVGPYCEGKEDWACYVERLEQFFIANDITDAPKIRAVFLSGIGPSTYSLLQENQQKVGQIIQAWEFWNRSRARECFRKDKTTTKEEESKQKKKAFICSFRGGKNK